MIISTNIELLVPRVDNPPVWILPGCENIIGNSGNLILPLPLENHVKIKLFTGNSYCYVENHTKSEIVVTADGYVIRYGQRVYVPETFTFGIEGYLFRIKRNTAGKIISDPSKVVFSSVDKNYSISVPASGSVSFGRGDALLKIIKPGISRIHGFIYKSPEGVTIDITGKNNDLTVNGSLKTHAIIKKNGPAIKSGNFTIILN